MGIPACSRCQSVDGVDAQGSCVNCGAPRGLVQVRVQCPELLRVGTNAVLLFAVESLTAQRLTGVALGLTNGPRFLAEGSDVEAAANGLAAQGREELDLQVVPRVDGRVLLHLTVRLRDAERDDWVYAGKLILRVAPASGAMGGAVNLDLDTSLGRGGITVHAGGQEVLAEPGDSAVLPLVLKERVRHEPRAIDVGVELDGRYRIERLLGKGAFGAVFRAVGISPDKLDQRFAIKTLRPELSDNPRQRRSFVREAQITAQLDQAHIVRLFDSGFYDGVPYLVMEYLEGPTGDDLLDESPDGLPVDEVVRIGRALCAALQHAHENNVFHRDVKPSNLMLAGDGTPKLTDFNLARVVKTQMSHLSAKENSGTAVYMSMEQILRPQKPTPQQDLWSLGVTLYELLTGEAPFQGDAGLVLQQIKYGDVPPLNDTVPAWLQTAVLRCLAREPEDRWSSAVELAGALVEQDSTAAQAPEVARESEEPRNTVGGRKTKAGRKAEQVAREQRGFRDQDGMVRIEPGTFRMGSAEGDEGHEVRLTRPFALARAPVTQALWATVMDSNPSQFSGDELPVETVRWLEAVEFCNRLSARSGLQPAYGVDGESVAYNHPADGFRLPTEAEWEYAARAGQRHVFAGGDDPSLVAVWERFVISATGILKIADRRPLGPVAVCSKQPNAWGLYDMSGNVWEWCWDWFGDYPAGPVTDPGGPCDGSLRVIRGGCWGNADPRFLRVASRHGHLPSTRKDHVGFRLARSLL